MSAEIDRFISNVGSDAALQAGVAACGNDLNAVLQLANQRGYRIGRAEVDSYIAAQRAELSDDQLDHVAGGGKRKHGKFDGWPGDPIYLDKGRHK